MGPCSFHIATSPQTIRTRSPELECGLFDVEPSHVSRTGEAIRAEHEHLQHQVATVAIRRVRQAERVVVGAIHFPERKRRTGKSDGLGALAGFPEYPANKIRHRRNLVEYLAHGFSGVVSAEIAGHAGANNAIAEVGVVRQ